MRWLSHLMGHPLDGRRAISSLRETSFAYLIGGACRIAEGTDVLYYLFFGNFGRVKLYRPLLSFVVHKSRFYPIHLGNQHLNSGSTSSAMHSFYVKVNFLH